MPRPFDANGHSVWHFILLLSLRSGPLSTKAIWKFFVDRKLVISKDNFYMTISRSCRIGMIRKNYEDKAIGRMGYCYELSEAGKMRVEKILSDIRVASLLPEGSAAAELGNTILNAKENSIQVYQGPGFWLAIVKKPGRPTDEELDRAIQVIRKGIQ